MKTLAVILSTFVSMTAFAERYVCPLENSEETLILSKVQDLPVNNDRIDSKAIYTLQFQTSELPATNPVEGLAVTSDVQFFFKSKNGLYKISMFMDDAAGTLTVSGKSREFSQCQYFKN